jgi:hypothetical protein
MKINIQPAICEKMGRYGALLNKRLMVIAVLALSLVVLTNTASAAPYVTSQFGLVYFAQPTVVTGGYVSIIFSTAGTGYAVYNSNAFIVFAPPSNSIVVQNLLLGVNPYTLPQCSPSLPLTDLCVMQPIVQWSPNQVITMSVQSQSDLPPGQYYYLAYLDTALDACGYTNGPQGSPPSGGGPQNCQPEPSPSPFYADAANILNVVPKAVPYITVGTATATDNKAQLMVLPGASAYVNYTFDGFACNQESFIELSAPGGSCVAPDSLSSSSTAPGSAVTAYCNENAASFFSSPEGGAIYPWAPCLFDTSQIYNTLSHSSLGSVTPYCSLAYFTNETLLQGEYSVCGFYQATAPNGNGGSSPVGSPPIETDAVINITQDDLSGPSYGLYITSSSPTFSATNPSAETFTLNANTMQGSPYSTYYSSISTTPPPLCSGPNPLTGKGCYMELALATSSGGCAPPNYAPFISSSSSTPSVYGSTLQYCSASVSAPCLLSTPTSSGQGTTGSIPSGVTLQQNGEYVVCAYDYIDVKYPNNPGTASTQTYYQNQNNYEYPSLAIFYASANIICNSGTCTPGQSLQQQSERVTGTLGLPVTATGGPTILNSPEIPLAGVTQSTVTTTAYGVSNIPLSLYFIPYVNQLSFTNFQTACASYSAVQRACTGGPGDANGCYISYTPSTKSPYACGYDGSSGAPPSTSCTCQQYVPPGCTVDSSGNVICPTSQNGGTTTLTTAPQVQCTIQTQSPQAVALSPGKYLYCEIYDNGYVAGSGAFLTVNPSPGVQQQTNPGVANIIPLTGELCYVYGSINDILFVFAMTVVLLGAVLYMASSVLPAQARGTIQGYAIGMLLGGIVGIAIAAFSVGVVSLATNVPVTGLLTACQ